ncbi:MAG: hypothetical protein EON59_11365 [Alphaproteobacteria bacterium]|nr:MAG: hypothetical protein EON59_11365 [Alphaproteobacteria bacterium]
MTGDEVQIALESLMTDYEEFHWAVAWGTSNSTAEKLLAQRKKFKAVTFGLAFSQTDPVLVEKLIGVRGSFVVKNFPKGTFHPKVYGFRSGDQAAAIIGSANFTNGGLGKNHEASVRIVGSANDPALADILSFAARSAKLGDAVTAELAALYRESCKRAAKLTKPPRDPFDGLKAVSAEALSSPIVSMAWPDYVRAVRRSAFHDVDKSLSLLGTSQSWLSGARSFRDLDVAQRKAIAGVIGQHERELSDELNQDWGWFGSMRGAGNFMNRISENDPFLADAVDSIPQRGEVTREHYERFASLFEKAFENSERTGRVPTASRLLAMKRPDVFVCISSPNAIRASRSLSFSRTTLDMSNYWDRVIEVLRSSDWYNVQKPIGRDGSLWECRAAMLDAIFYDPD